MGQRIDILRRAGYLFAGDNDGQFHIVCLGNPSYTPRETALCGRQLKLTWYRRYVDPEDDVCSQCQQLYRDTP